MTYKYAFQNASKNKYNQMLRIGMAKNGIAYSMGLRTLINERDLKQIAIQM
jgi:hypothetical protein